MPRVIAEVDLIKTPSTDTKREANKTARANGFKSGGNRTVSGEVRGKAVMIVPQQPKSAKYKNTRPVEAETTGKKAIIVLREKEPMKRVKKAPEPTERKSKAVPVTPKARGTIPKPREIVPKIVTADSRLKQPQFAKIREELTEIRDDLKEMKTLPKFYTFMETFRYEATLDKKSEILRKISVNLVNNHGFKKTDKEIVKIDKLIKLAADIKKEVKAIGNKKIEKIERSKRAKSSEEE